MGANIGQSAKAYLKAFPEARIYSFEPVAATYQALVANMGQQSPDRFVAVNSALGAEIGEGRMDTRHGGSDMFQLTEDGNESVEITTLDHFCENIPFIDFLKIDAEGHDLQVLKGADRMLREKRIGALQVEAGMNPHNRRHVPLEDFKSYLEEREYFIFGIYDQVFEWPTGEPHLRRINAVFIRRRPDENSITKLQA